jgi:hypothetical protein
VENIKLFLLKNHVGRVVNHLGEDPNHVGRAVNHLGDYDTFSHLVMERTTNGEMQYINLLQNVISNGTKKIGRNGATRSTFPVEEFLIMFLIIFYKFSKI